MKVIAGLAVVAALACAACGGVGAGVGGGSASGNARLGVSPEGGVCELPEDGTTIVTPIGDGGSTASGTFVTVCPNDGQNHCLVWNGENCCCAPYVATPPVIARVVQ